jgi:hypothetical protein
VRGGILLTSARPPVNTIVRPVGGLDHPVSVAPAQWAQPGENPWTTSLVGIKPAWSRLAWADCGYWQSLRNISFSHSKLVDPSIVSVRHAEHLRQLLEVGGLPGPKLSTDRNSIRVDSGPSLGAGIELYVMS